MRTSTLSLQRSLARAAVGLAALLTVQGTARADVLVSSLDTPYDLIGFSPGAWAASPFQTDGQAWSLTSARLELALGALSESTAAVYLYADDGGQPGTALADLGSQVVTGSTDFYTFSPLATVVLDPSTTYWIAVGNLTPSGGLNVGVSGFYDPFTFTGVPGASMTQSAASAVGATFMPPTVWNPAGTGVAILFEINATPVPEPGLLSLLALSAGCFWIAHRHRLGTR